MVKDTLQTIEPGRDSSTFMGLESYLTSESPQIITERKKTIRRAIIQEQARQLELGIHDPERMALLAKSLSQVSADRARIIGLLHAGKET